MRRGLQAERDRQGGQGASSGQQGFTPRCPFRHKPCSLAKPVPASLCTLALSRCLRRIEQRDEDSVESEGVSAATATTRASQFEPARSKAAGLAHGQLERQRGDRIRPSGRGEWHGDGVRVAGRQRTGCERPSISAARCCPGCKCGRQLGVEEVQGCNRGGPSCKRRHHPQATLLLASDVWSLILLTCVQVQYCTVFSPSPRASPHGPATESILWAGRQVRSCIDKANTSSKFAVSWASRP